jgi:C-terminal peptidase prc
VKHSAHTRLEYGIACLLLIVLTACLLTCLCTAGSLIPWPTTPPTHTPTPPNSHTQTPTPPNSQTYTPNSTTARHLRIFTELWEIVRDGYLYPDYNGVDWDAVGQEYRARVEAGLSDEEFWFAMGEMIFALGDEHSVFLPPDAAEAEDLMFSGEMEYVGVGVSTAIPWEVEKKYAVILLVLPDSPAERAGLRAHDHILTVDGHPACCDEYGYDSLYLLTGPEGSDVELRVRTPGQPPRTVTMTRATIRGPAPVETRMLEGNVGYILIPTFWDESIVARVRQALEELELAAGGELAGLVIDNRINPGGSDNALRGVLAFFTDGKVGCFTDNWSEESLYVDGIDVEGSQHVPLVILVGRETASFGEVFSGVLQELGRARVVGRTTPGNIETTHGYDFEDGSRAWIAQEVFRPPSGADWEETGIVPDVEIPLDWDEFTVKDDPQLDAALDLLHP